MLYNVTHSNGHSIYYRLSSEGLNDGLCVLELGYNIVPAGLRQVMTRNVYIIHYIVNGKGRLLDQSFSAGDIYTNVPNELEIMESDPHDTFESYWIMLRGSAVPELFDRLGIQRHNQVSSFNDNQRCANIINKYLFDVDFLNELEEASAMQQALYELLRVHFIHNTDNMVKTDRRAEEIANFIENNYQYDLKISSLARHFGLSQNHLCTIFKKEHRVTPQEYLISVRIEKAKQLLMNSSKKFTVSEIALAVGFEDALYFSKSFHKRVGVSPSEFRRQTRHKYLQ